jgi:hypothetical protein
MAVLTQGSSNHPWTTLEAFLGLLQPLCQKGRFLYNDPRTLLGPLWTFFWASCRRCVRMAVLTQRSSNLPWAALNPVLGFQEPLCQTNRFDTTLLEPLWVPFWASFRRKGRVDTALLEPSLDHSKPRSEPLLCQKGCFDTTLLEPSLDLSGPLGIL